MSFNRPDPSRELRDKVEDVRESILEETQVFWAELGAVILAETAVYELYQDDDGIVVMQNTYSSRGWEEV